MSEELKPCPFCGGKGVIKAVNKNYGFTIWCQCKKCSAKTEGYCPNTNNEDDTMENIEQCKTRLSYFGTGGQTMGRLIDADAFERTVMFGDAEDMQDVIYALRDYPTAYDPDKVVEQLKEVEKIMTSPVNEDCFGEECRASDCTVCLISKAIEIVKGGGVEWEG